MPSSNHRARLTRCPHCHSHLSLATTKPRNGLRPPHWALTPLTIPTDTSRKTTHRFREDRFLRSPETHIRWAESIIDFYPRDHPPAPAQAKCPRQHCDQHKQKTVRIPPVPARSALSIRFLLLRLFTGSEYLSYLNPRAPGVACSPLATLHCPSIRARFVYFRFVFLLPGVFEPLPCVNLCTKQHVTTRSPKPERSCFTPETARYAGPSNLCSFLLVRTKKPTCSVDFTFFCEEQTKQPLQCDEFWRQSLHSTPLSFVFTLAQNKSKEKSYPTDAVRSPSFFGLRSGPVSCRSPMHS